MKLPSTIRIALAITSMTLAASSAQAHPGKPGHTHSGDEWPFSAIEWSMIGLGAAALLASAATLHALRRRSRAARTDAVAR